MLLHSRSHNLKHLPIQWYRQKKNGNIYRYYKCASAKRHECDKKAVRKEWIAELVLNKVIKVLFDDEALDKIADEIVALLDEENKVIPLLEAQFHGTPGAEREQQRG